MYRYLLVFIPFSLFAQKKETQYFDDQWQPVAKKEASYSRVIRYNAQGKPLGLVRDYYSTGTLKWEGKLLSDRPDVYDSTCVWYFPNGKAQERSFFRNGKKEGKAVFYYETGNKMEASYFKEGLKEGGDSTYNGSGTLSLVKWYEKGKRNGKVYMYFQKGKLQMVQTYAHDTLHGPYTEFSFSGDTLSHCTYVKGKKRGEQVRYNGKGKVVWKCSDEENGKQVCYHYDENGQLESLSTYQNGLQEGETKEWDSKGRLRRTRYYVMGKQNGPDRSYYSNGKLQTDFHFKDHRPDGANREYYPHGILHSEVWYSDGKMMTSKEYYPNGKLYKDIHAEDSLGRKWVFTYDKNGKRLKESEVEFPCFLDSINNYPPRWDQHAFLAKDNIACLYGFKGPNDKWVIQPQFTKAFYLPNALTIVSTNEKYGLVEPHGNISVPLVYDKLSQLSLYKTNFTEPESLFFIAEQNGKKGIIDYLNKVKIPFEYDEIEFGFHDRLFLKKNGRFLLWKNGQPLKETTIKEISEFTKDHIYISENGKYGVADKNGHVLVAARYRNILMEEDGMLLIGKEGAGFANLKGQVLLDTLYDILHTGTEVLEVRLKEKKGLFHPSGKWLVPLGNQPFNVHRTGDFLLVEKEKQEVFNEKGQPFFPHSKWQILHVLSQDYEYFGHSYRSHWFLVKEGNKYWVVDTSGNKVLKESFQYAIATNYDRLLLGNGQKAVAYKPQADEWVQAPFQMLDIANKPIQIGKEYFVFDESGALQLRSKQRVGAIYLADQEENETKTVGYFLVKGKKTVMTMGKEQLEVGQVLRHVEVLDSTYLVVTDTKQQCGIVDRKGKAHVKTQYPAVSSFVPELNGFWVQTKTDSVEGQEYRKGNWGVIDTQGKYLLAPDYMRPVPFKEGFAIAGKSSGLGMITSKGEIRLPFKYDKIASIHPQLLLLEKEGKYGLAGRTGKMLFEPVWSNMTRFCPDHALFYQQDEEINDRGERQERQGIVDTLGNIVFPLSEPSFRTANIDIGDYFAFYSYEENGGVISMGTKKLEWKELIAGYEKLEEYKNVKLRRSLSNLLISHLLRSHTIKGGESFNSLEPRSPIYDHKGKMWDKEAFLARKNSEYNEHSARVLATNKRSFACELRLTRSRPGYYHVYPSIHNFAIKGDSIVELFLPDLFRPQADYSTLLNNLLLEKIKKLDVQDIDYSVPDALLQKAEDKWSIGPEGLTFLFAVQDASSGSEELKAERIVIPYASLAKIILPQGPLGEFLVEKKK